jgi:hypothetical protein
MLEICNAVGNEDSRFSGKETLGTDDVVLTRSGVRRCYGRSGEGWHTKNVAGDMRINRGQDSAGEKHFIIANSQIGSGIHCTRQCDSSTLSTTRLELQVRNMGSSMRKETYSDSCTITTSSDLRKPSVVSVNRDIIS